MSSCPYLPGPCALCGGVDACLAACDVPEGATPAQALALRLYGECSPPRVMCETLRDTRTGGDVYRLTVGRADYDRAAALSSDGERVRSEYTLPPRPGQSHRRRVEWWDTCEVGGVTVRTLVRYEEWARPSHPCPDCGQHIERRTHNRRLTPCPHTPKE